MTASNIKVAIRVRPSLPGESVLEDGLIKINNQGNSIEVKNALFAFDTIFAPDVSNKDIYEQLVSEKIKNLFEGFNVSILAYGSTGAGKTYTIGTSYKVQHSQEDSLGLIPLGLTEIFKKIDSISNEFDVVAKASFFEIYMESVKDLLKADALFVPGDSKEAKITNMTQEHVTSFKEAMQALRTGCQARTTGFTLKNPRSSRSHAFYIISLVMTDKNTGKSKFSKFQLIDLAGSERAGTDTSGKEFKQGVQINKGLTALGRVISSLSKKDRHIPYRDSVLTRYLQDSFGGNSHTVMITCVSPAQANIEETLSSLRYSGFAKKIQNNVVINRDSTDAIEHLKLELERLRKNACSEENVELSNKVTNLNNRLVKAVNCVEKIKERTLEFASKIQSLEAKMVSETHEEPLLQQYIDIIRSIKEDFNSFVKEHELFGSDLNNRNSSSSEEMNTSPRTVNMLEDVQNAREESYALKCKEVDELKKKLEAVEEENRELRYAQLKLPALAARSRKLKPKTSDPNISMIEAFLSEDDVSFIQESEILDPDYRGTPMYKRNRPNTKRKCPEDTNLSSSPKLPKEQRFSISH